MQHMYKCVRYILISQLKHPISLRVKVTAIKGKEKTPWDKAQPMNERDHVVTKSEVPHKPRRSKSHWSHLPLFPLLIWCLLVLSLSQQKANTAGRIENQHGIVTGWFSEPSQDMGESDYGWAELGTVWIWLWVFGELLLSHLGNLSPWFPIWQLVNRTLE